MCTNNRLLAAARCKLAAIICCRTKPVWPVVAMIKENCMSVTTGEFSDSVGDLVAGMGRLSADNTDRICRGNNLWSGILADIAKCQRT
jgi:hypothetical protein